VTEKTKRQIHQYLVCGLLCGLLLFFLLVQHATSEFFHCNYINCPGPWSCEGDVIVYDGCNVTKCYQGGLYHRLFCNLVI
jgi:hypothetical protein